MHFLGWAKKFHIWLIKPPTCSLRPIIPNNASTLRITAAAGTELAGASSGGTVKTDSYSESACSSHLTELYDPKAFITHAALLRQGFPHCAKFLTAASRRSLDRVSVPVWLIILSDQLTIVALVGHYPTNKLMVREPLPERQLSWRGHLSSKRPQPKGQYPVLATLSRSYPRIEGRLPTRYSPVRHFTLPTEVGISRSTCMC